MKRSYTDRYGSDTPKIIVLAFIAAISLIVAAVGTFAASIDFDDTPMKQPIIKDGNDFVAEAETEKSESGPTEEVTAVDEQLTAETVPLPIITPTENANEPITEQNESETEQDELIEPASSERSSIVDALAKIETDYPDAALTSTEDGGMDYIDRIIFLGDSTTYGLMRYGILSDGMRTTQVWTPKSGTLTLSLATYATIVYPDDGTEITIPEAVARKKPEIMVITLGVNGISFMKEDYFKGEYGKLIDEITAQSPDTKIILQSMFPIAKSYQKQHSINNDKIAAANSWIAALAAEKGVKYANTVTALIADDGYLPEEYQNGDGLHLNYTGYEIELNYLSTHMIDDDTYVNAPTKLNVTEPVEAETPKPKPVETIPPETEPVETTPPVTDPVEATPPETEPIETIPPETQSEETTVEPINDRFVP